MLRDRIASAPGGALVLDGGLATELEGRGHDLGDHLWSARLLADDPEAIAEIHRDYLRAGADVITTASYQATIPGFVQAGLSRADAASLIERSFLLARDAVRDVAPGALVAASIGSYGAFLSDGSEYRGRYALGVEELIRFHRDRVELLVEAGAELLAFETIPSVAEIAAIVRLLEELPARIEAWISVSPEALGAGEPLADALRVAGASQKVVLTGANCAAPSTVLALLAAARASGVAPLVAYPNRGERWDAARHGWSTPVQDLELSDFAVQARALGAVLIGGCCRTTPADIERVARRIRAEVPR